MLLHLLQLQRAPRDSLHSSVRGSLSLSLPWCPCLHRPVKICWEVLGAALRHQQLRMIVGMPLDNPIKRPTILLRRPHRRSRIFPTLAPHPTNPTIHLQLHRNRTLLILAKVRLVHHHSSSNKILLLPHSSKTLPTLVRVLHPSHSSNKILLLHSNRRTLPTLPRVILPNRSSNHSNHSNNQTLLPLHSSKTLPTLVLRPNNSSSSNNNNNNSLVSINNRKVVRRNSSEILVT